MELLQDVLNAIALAGQTTALLNLAGLTLLYRYIRSERQQQFTLRLLQLRVSKDRITADQGLVTLLVLLVLSVAAVVFVK